MITPHHTIKCIAKKHYCVCNYISILNNNTLNNLGYTENCKSNDHPCVCHLGNYFKNNCKSNDCKKLI